LQDAYDQCNGGQQSPTFKSLLTMLEAVVEGFDNLFLVMDALDECPKNFGQRKKLLGVIKCINLWKTDCIHLMATSRREDDIAAYFEKTMGLEPATEICVKGKHVQKDIRKFLSLQLEDISFSDWSTDLKKEVETSLACRADGMYGLFMALTAGSVLTPVSGFDSLHYSWMH
jgi:hypothetical protein